MSFLVDTDICSAYLKGNHQVWNRFVQPGGRLHVSAITAAELFVWALRARSSSARLTALIEMLQDVPLLAVDGQVSHKFGEVRAHQLDQGLYTPDLDLLIAATALVHGLTLATHNGQDFTAVPGLRVVDWLAP